MKQKLEDSLKVPQSPKEKKATQTAFILIFPSLIVAAIGIYSSNAALAVVIVLLTIYQMLMTKNFIEDYWKKQN